ncbi:MAG: hypothetical protein ABFC94_11435 [Syntrophomonas sp.]
MMGQYMMGYGGGIYWLWMFIMMLAMVAGWIILLLALWRIMTANQSIARSVEEIAKKSASHPPE